MGAFDGKCIDFNELDDPKAKNDDINLTIFLEHQNQVNFRDSLALKPNEVNL